MRDLGRLGELVVSLLDRNYSCKKIEKLYIYKWRSVHATTIKKTLNNKKATAFQSLIKYMVYDGRQVKKKLNVALGVSSTSHNLVTGLESFPCATYFTKIMIMFSVFSKFHANHHLWGRGCTSLLSNFDLCYVDLKEIVFQDEFF